MKGNKTCCLPEDTQPKEREPAVEAEFMLLEPCTQLIKPVLLLASSFWDSLVLGLSETDLSHGM